MELREYDPENQRYTGREALMEVTYILDQQPFVPQGYVCMSIKSYWTYQELTEEERYG